jgi:hypothetical protein
MAKAKLQEEYWARLDYMNERCASLGCSYSTQQELLGALNQWSDNAMVNLKYASLTAGLLPYLPEADNGVFSGNLDTANASSIGRLLSKLMLAMGMNPQAASMANTAALDADLAATSAGPAEMAAAMRARLAQQGGFSGNGVKIIIDENLPQGWAQELRAAGYDARSISELEMMGASDVEINQLATQLGAKVVTRDRGRQMDGGFGSNAIVIDGRVSSIESVKRILEGR